MGFHDDAHMGISPVTVHRGKQWGMKIALHCFGELALQFASITDQFLALVVTLDPLITQRNRAAGDNGKVSSEPRIANFSAAGWTAINGVLC